MAIKAKNVMYVQQVSKLPDDNLVDLIKRVESDLNPSPFKYAAIVHDKDLNEDNEPVEPHVHVVMQFENARSLDNIAKQLDDLPQNIQWWKGRVNNAYSYLIHQTNNSQHTYQYDTKEVIANFDYEELISSIHSNVVKKTGLSDSVIINNTLDLLYEGEISKDDAEKRLTGSQYAKAAKRIEAVYQKRMEILATEWREEMRTKNEPVIIIWLYGEAGTGKTRIAKEYAKNYSEDFYLSGSSRDPFQKYDGETVVILDELRPNAFDYSDLLKMLDPYNDQAMASSRYFDKPLTSNVFIITTPYSPKGFYDEIKNRKLINSKIDSFKQLARRITLVQMMTKKDMYFLSYDSKFEDFLKVNNSKKQNPYYISGTTKYISKNKASEVYEKLTDSLMKAKEGDVNEG